jgi:hypothetical protein
MGGFGIKPIWLVTNAAPTADHHQPAPDSLFRITPGQQADFVVQAAMSYALGVERMAIDRLVDVSERPRRTA